MRSRFDVLVVGAGPGGMAAAATAAAAGSQVCLVDDNTGPGGQVWRGCHEETAAKYPHGDKFLDWMGRLARTRCEVSRGWQVIDAPDAQVLRLERGGVTRDVGYDKLILATGARERFLPFPGWTLPGVMGAGGLQALVKSGLDVRGKGVVVAGSGPLLLAVAAGLARAGSRVKGIYEQAPLSRVASFALWLLHAPGKLAEGAGYRLKTLRAPYRTGSWVVSAEGRGRVERATMTDGRRQWTVECEWLGCGFNLVPNLELPRLLGCRVDRGFVEVDALQQSSVAGVACIGELTGIGGLDKALIEGQIAGYAAAGRDLEARDLAPERMREMRFAQRLEEAFRLREELRGLSNADTVVCRCEDVTHGELEGCASWRQAKLHTRCGMGACQGRVCSAATDLLFGWECDSGRPPIFPAAVSSLAAVVRKEALPVSRE
jgi:NADPH-dependent 2,4-dienoyl-CoA reductase/sulfur reductase-like enzyme